MYEQSRSVEFEGVIDEHGKIAVPKALLKRCETGTGGKVHVRLTGTLISAELKDRRVSGEEIEQIASLQRESRDQVVKFLLSEGAWRNHKALKGKPRKIGKRAKA